MKRLPLFLLYTLLSIPAVAQQTDSIQLDAISKLNWLAGQWKGEGFAEYLSIVKIPSLFIFIHLQKSSVNR
jgi:hypothetical protein